MLSLHTPLLSFAEQAALLLPRCLARWVPSSCRIVEMFGLGSHQHYDRTLAIAFRNRSSMIYFMHATSV
jgi:hypothetical protein